MFKVNNKNTRITSMTLFSSVSIADFEQVNVSWVTSFIIFLQLILDILPKCKPQIIVTQNFQIAFQSIIFKIISSYFLLKVLDFL